MSDFVLSRLTRAARFAMMASALACAAQVHAQANPSDDDEEDEAPPAAAVKAPANATTKAAAPPPSASPSSGKYTLRIRESSLGAALSAWALQTGFQIVFASEEVAKLAPAAQVDGTMTAR